MRRGWGRRSLVVFVAVLAAVALGVAGNAEAQKVFNYTQEGGFTIGTETTTDFNFANTYGPTTATGMEFFGPQPDNTPPLPAPVGEPAQYSTLQWGSNTAADNTANTTVINSDPFAPPTTKSALRIETLSGQVTTNGVFETISVLTHRNININPRFLKSIVIDTILRLFDPDAANAPVVDGSNIPNVGSSPIVFHETNNHSTLPPADALAQCDTDIQIGTIPCTDYFTFVIGATFEPVTFTYQGVVYTINFRLQPIGGAEIDFVDCTNDAGPEVDPTTFQGQLCGRLKTAEGSTNQIAIQMAITAEDVPPPGDTCPHTQGFWKNHEEAIDAELEGVGFLTVGTTNYTRDQLVAIFRTPPKGGNAVLILAHQLIAAKLNLLAGSDAAPIIATVNAADALLAGHLLPDAFVKTSTTLGAQMVALANTLDQYNNGANTPICTPFD